MTAKKKIDVKTACLEEAERILETDGIEAINMREVARRLGISHNTPYMHYPSRDHVIAALVTRAFDRFGAALRPASQAESPEERLDRMVMAYLDFAKRHPAVLQLLFNTPLPDQKSHPEMLKRSRPAYELLKDAVANLPAIAGSKDRDMRAETGAMFVWASIHGYSTLQSSPAWKRLGFSRAARRAVETEIAAQIRKGLDRD